MIARWRGVRSVSTTASRATAPTRHRAGACATSRRWVLAAALLVLGANGSRAATPAEPEATAIAIVGGTVHTLAGPPIEQGTVVVGGGVIVAVGRDVAVPSGARVIDAAGLVVAPGFFDAMSTIGLSEIGSLAATQDTVELGAFNPHLLALAAINPASEHVAVARANGVTHAGSAPASPGYGIPGRASAVHLDGWTVEEMTLEPEIGVVVTWPDLVTRRFDRATARFSDRPFTEARKEYDERVAEIRGWIEAARRYQAAMAAPATARPDPDLRLEGLVDVVAGRLPLLVRADREREVRDAVAFAAEESLRMVLVGGRESWRVADLLAEKQIPVILGPTQVLPPREDDPYDRSFALARDLRAAGVMVAISSFGAAASFTLPYEAAQAVAFGLPWEEGLAAISQRPAEILGLADRIGTLEPGMIANLIVTSGDPLEIRTRVVQVLVRGRPVDLATKHTRSYERYRARPLASKTQ
jgi:imidazolonepropionase-like amidohydrolase